MYVYVYTYIQGRPHVQVNLLSMLAQITCTSLLERMWLTKEMDWMALLGSKLHKAILSECIVISPAYPWYE